MATATSAHLVRHNHSLSIGVPLLLDLFILSPVSLPLLVSLLLLTCDLWQHNLVLIFIFKHIMHVFATLFLFYVLDTVD